MRKGNEISRTSVTFTFWGMLERLSLTFYIQQSVTLLNALIYKLLPRPSVSTEKLKIQLTRVISSYLNLLSFGG